MKKSAFGRHRSVLRVLSIPLAVSGLALLATVPALAEVVWNGQTSTDFLTGTNWDGNTAPASTDDFTVNNGGAANQPTLPTNQITTVNSGTVTAGTLTINGDLTATNGITVSGSGNVNNNGKITGSLLLNGGTVGNAGIVTGSTTVSAGTLNLNPGTLLSDADALTVNGGTVNVNADETVGGLSGSGGTVSIDGAATLTVSQSGNSTYGGTITGLGALTKTGSGTLTLSGANTYIGKTTVSAGTLAFIGSGALASSITQIDASGTLTTDGGALLGSVTNDGTLNIQGNESIDLQGLGNVNLSNNATLTLQDLGSTDIFGVISGAGNLVVAGGTIILHGDSTYTGTTGVTGGELRITGSVDSTVLSTAVGATLLVDGGALATNATVTNNGSFVVEGLESIGELDNTGSTTLTASLTLNSGTSSLGGTVTGAGGLSVAGGTANVTSALSYSGTTSVAGGNMNVTGTGSLASQSINITAGRLTADSGAFSPAAALSISGSGILDVTGDHTVASITATDGTIDMQDGADGNSSIRVTGNYSGDQTGLALDAFLGGPGSVADELIVLGNVSGTTLISINDTNAGIGAYNPDGIALVEVQGAADASSFSLVGGPITKGLFTYDLVRDGDVFELVSELSEAASTPISAVSGAQSIFLETADAWVARQDSLRDSLNQGPVIRAVADPVTVEDVPGALWLSAIGSLSDRDAHGAVLGYEQSTYGLVGGADFGTRLGENATLLFGVQAGHVGSSMDVSDGLGSDVDLDGTSIGASASLLSGNFFANVQVSADFLKSDIRIGASPTVDTDAATYGIRSDMGYRLENGNGLFIEPMVSVLASQTNLDSFVISGVTFEDSSNDMFLLGAGSRLGLASDGFSASVTARVWNNLSDDNTIVLTPVGPALTVTDSGLFGGTFGEVEGKASVDFNENGNFFVTARARFDQDAASLAGQAGVSFKW